LADVIKTNGCVIKRTIFQTKGIIPLAPSAMMAMINHHNHMKAMISPGYPHFRSMEVDGGEGVVPREP
jgi:hypothetical protein